jgi:undecaprenyl-diphosphatase
MPSRTLLDRLCRPEARELGLLLLLVLLAGSLWAFIAIADNVADGDTVRLDRTILLAMRSAADPADPIGSELIEEIARDLTALGGIFTLSFLTLSIAGFLALQRKWHTVLLLVIAIAGGLTASSILKHAFDRPRPDLVPHGSHIYTSSFPSGHSMMAAVTYLTLAALLMRTVTSRRIKLYILSLALLLTLLIGTSRVYLGVHWPTDVLAGWTIGAAWAILAWLLTRKLQRTGQVEPESTV